MNKFFLLVVLSLLSLTSSFAETIHYRLDTSNGTISETSFPDHYQLIVFGFTSCPDVCPTTLYQIGKALNTMQHAQQLQVVFITVDPFRDSTERLDQYVHYFHPDIIAARGSFEQISEVVDRFNGNFGYRFKGEQVAPPNLPEGYEVYHSTLLYLLDDQGELLDLYDYQIGYQELSKQLDRFIEQHDEHDQQRNSQNDEPREHISEQGDAS